MTSARTTDSWLVRRQTDSVEEKKRELYFLTCVNILSFPGIVFSRDAFFRTETRWRRRREKRREKTREKRRWGKENSRVRDHLSLIYLLMNFSDGLVIYLPSIVFVSFLSFRLHNRVNDRVVSANGISLENVDYSMAVQVFERVWKSSQSVGQEEDLHASLQWCHQSISQ